MEDLKKKEPSKKPLSQSKEYKNMKWTLWASVVGVLSIVLAYYIYPVFLHHDPAIKMLHSLEAQAGTKTTDCGRVAIGYNTNLDLIVDAVELLNALNVKPGDVFAHSRLTSLKELQETFSYYIESGSAAERIVEDEGVFQQIVKAAKSLHQKNQLIGGNAALMAERLAEENCKILLGGHVGSTLQSLLPKQVEVITYEGASKEDEIHLIMEYKTGTKWGKHVAPRANRFIVTRDLTNSKIRTLEPFHQALPKFDPSLVIISGLHLLESETTEFRNQRMADMLALLKDLPLNSKSDNSSVVAHLELASIGSTDLLTEIAEKAVPRFDSLGLNEQELGGVYLATGGSNYTAEDFRNPTPEIVVHAIKHIFRLTQSKLDKESRRNLTRIHFHCLTFHIVAQQSISDWESGGQSVVAGSLACTKRACDNKEFDVPLNGSIQVAKHKSIKIDHKHPNATWVDGDYTYNLTPVLVCRKPTRTVGLGDSISSIGLLHHARVAPLPEKDRDTITAEAQNVKIPLYDVM